MTPTGNILSSNFKNLETKQQKKSGLMKSRHLIQGSNIMKNSINILLIVLISIISISCSRAMPIYNVENSPIPFELTEKKIGKSIINAGILLGWQVKTVNPGIISAKLFLRKHVAEVEIKFDNKQYSITYKNSENLNYNEGKIHKNYNSWIRNLDRGIQRQFLLISN